MNTETQFQYVAIATMVESNCFAISFFRPTTSNEVSINGLPLEAGQTIFVEQNFGDIDKSKYEVKFNGGSATNILHVIRVCQKG